jgi:hypothetical protein
MLISNLIRLYRTRSWRRIAEPTAGHCRRADHIDDNDGQAGHDAWHSLGQKHMANDVPATAAISLSFMIILD